VATHVAAVTEINCIVLAERCAGVQHAIALSPRRQHHGMMADDDLSEAMAHLSSPLSTEQFAPIDQRKLSTQVSQADAAGDRVHNNTAN